MAEKKSKALESWNAGEQNDPVVELREKTLNEKLKARGYQLFRAENQPGFYLCGKEGRLTHQRPITLAEMMLFWDVDLHGETLEEQERAAYEQTRNVAKQLGFTIESSRKGCRLLMHPIYGGFDQYSAARPFLEVAAELEQKRQLLEEAQSIVAELSGYAFYRSDKDPDQYTLCIPASDTDVKVGTLGQVLQCLLALQKENAPYVAARASKDAAIEKMPAAERIELTSEWFIGRGVPKQAYALRAVAGQLPSEQELIEWADQLQKQFGEKGPYHSPGPIYVTALRIAAENGSAEAGKKLRESPYLQKMNPLFWSLCAAAKLTAADVEATRLVGPAQIEESIANVLKRGDRGGEGSGLRFAWEYALQHLSMLSADSRKTFESKICGILDAGTNNSSSISTYLSLDFLKASGVKPSDTELQNSANKFLSLNEQFYLWNEMIPSQDRTTKIEELFAQMMRLHHFEVLALAKICRLLGAEHPLVQKFRLEGIPGDLDLCTTEGKALLEALYPDRAMRESVLAQEIQDRLTSADFNGALILHRFFNTSATALPNQKALQDGCVKALKGGLESSYPLNKPPLAFF